MHNMAYRSSAQIFIASIFVDILFAGIQECFARNIASFNLSFLDLADLLDLTQDNRDLTVSHAFPHLFRYFK